MAETDEILRQFALLAGIPEEEARQYQALIELAAAETRKRLKPGYDNEANAQRITLLCAANALCRYVLLTGAQGGGTVKLGDVSVTANPEREEQSARRLLEELTAACADILTDSGFLFGQMEGQVCR